MLLLQPLLILLIGRVISKAEPLFLHNVTSSSINQNVTFDTVKHFPNSTEIDFRELSRHTEGDIIDHENIMTLATAMSVYWPDAVVPYYFTGGFDEDQKETILGAMRAIEEVTCVRFREYDGCGSPHVAVTWHEHGCSSHIGMAPERQSVFLGDKCIHHGVIMHELLHALGVQHTHNLPNRDEYITVHWDNIKPDYRHDFEKLNSSVVEDFGVEYDYDSIMHYNSHSFSRNGQATIVPKDKSARIGQRKKLSEGDIITVNRMYDCGEIDDNTTL